MSNSSRSRESVVKEQKRTCATSQSTKKNNWDAVPETRRSTSDTTCTSQHLPQKKFREARYEQVERGRGRGKRAAPHHVPRERTPPNDKSQPPTNVNPLRDTISPQRFSGAASRSRSRLNRSARVSSAPPVPRALPRGLDRARLARRPCRSRRAIRASAMLLPTRRRRWASRKQNS